MNNEIFNELNRYNIEKKNFFEKFSATTQNPISNVFEVGEVIGSGQSRWQIKEFTFDSIELVDFKYPSRIRPIQYDLLFEFIDFILNNPNCSDDVLREKIKESNNAHYDKFLYGYSATLKLLANEFINRYEKQNDTLKSSENIESTNKANFFKISKNRIVFGAPGTGKSNLLERQSIFFKQQDLKSDIYVDRVTFHPNYNYQNFVGTYKPISQKTELNGKILKEISYEYIPGPFMRVYVNAKKNPKKNFLLLIEEINRANVAAVFGDVFQLLDRQSDGTSQYPIAASEDQKNYLESCGINDDEISIPSNMYIWATMNSADQGVLPMDAAFKRRWDFEYIDIDDNEDSIKNYVLPIPHKDSDGNISYTSENWNKIRHAINNKLKNIYGVNEDKLLGPYFLSKSTLDEAEQINYETETDKAEKICSLFKSKVLMYLYEDVVKMNPTELFNKSVFSEDKPLHYSDLCNKFDELGLKIFDEDFIK
ncbi:MAG: AAA family ATPase [Treponema sp.]|nr:AAA family ATPase [Treponema sp.]